MDDELTALKARVRDFVAEREWERFHSPKNLAMALIVEAAELVENFQWLTEEQSAQLDAAKRERVEHEIADVFIYLLSLSDRLGIDLLHAAGNKLELNARKYPVDKARGNALKYDEF